MFNKIFIKAVMIIIFLLIFNSPISCYAMNTEGKSDNGLCYEITNYGTVTITGYTGVESEIVIPETIEGYNVTSIGASAFSGNKLLTKITMPYVKVIGESAFSNTGLESVNLTGITSMGNYAFSGCDNLSAVELIDVSSMGCLISFNHSPLYLKNFGPAIEYFFPESFFANAVSE